jgi:predicted nucleic acid-binding protein
VLQEFYVQATRSSKPDRMSHDQARLLIESFIRFPVHETTLPLILAALDSKERYQISYWEAAIIEAARALGCQQVITEDLNDGQEFDGVVIVNPFREL